MNNFRGNLSHISAKSATLVCINDLVLNIIQVCLKYFDPTNNMIYNKKTTNSRGDLTIHQLKQITGVHR